MKKILKTADQSLQDYAIAFAIRLMSRLVPPRHFVSIKIQRKRARKTEPGPWTGSFAT